MLTAADLHYHDAWPDPREQDPRRVPVPFAAFYAALLSWVSWTDITPKALPALPSPRRRSTEMFEGSDVRREPPPNPDLNALRITEDADVRRLADVLAERYPALSARAIAEEVTAGIQRRHPSRPATDIDPALVSWLRRRDPR